MSPAAMTDGASTAIGRWSVGEADPLRIGYARCVCACGAIRSVRRTSLLSGGSRSCGCLAREISRVKMAAVAVTHGMSGSGTYRSWQAMRSRCQNARHRAYPDYGGRGIRVCDSWGSFEIFLADMGTRPDGHTLDRINNSGNYEPGNCRWATRLQQQQNMRTTVLVQLEGESLSVSEWSRRTGIPKRTLAYRVAAGWPVARALTTRRILAAEARK